jgi:hypothetical protein
MSTYEIRNEFVKTARKDVGVKETSRNNGPGIKKFWGATTYPEGYSEREPYCAAAMCYWLKTWLENPAALAALGKTAAQAEAWRCKSARAFDWLDWAKAKGLQILSDSREEVLHTGDIMVFDMSHIGLVFTDFESYVQTVEANTGSAGGRDGDGVFEKIRSRSLARSFIRILP